MGKNDGKQFEKIIREQLKEIKGVSVDRINDNIGYAGAYNIADLIVYRYPHKFYIECKTVRGTSFPFANINEKALRDLVFEKINRGVGCFYLIWFIDLDKTICVDAEQIYNAMYVNMQKSIGVKSFKNFDFIEVEGKKKRKFYKYNVVKLLDELDRDIL